MGIVKLTLPIYQTIIATTVRYANPRIPEEEWAEVYGLLFGYNDGEDVIVTEAIPFTHTKKKGHILRVEFDEEDYALAASIESEFYTRDPPQFIVGWYHSHPGIKIMMSQDDIKNQLAWQTNNPLAIALVFNMVRLQKQIEMPAKKGDPVKQLHNDPGFEIYRLDDTSGAMKANYHKIDFVFTDYPLDENLIRNAQEFAGWVAKAFPRGDQVIVEYERYINSTLKKLEDIYNGTASYCQTLERKMESHRIPEVVANQIEEAQKILDQANTMVSIYRMMPPFLEYKERDRLVPAIQNILDKWDKESVEIMNKLQSLSNR